jgi:hypothetical protein
MTTLAGSVSIDGAGVATGSGTAKALYDLFIATPAYSGIVVNVALGYTLANVVTARRQLADLVNTMAAISDRPQWIPTSVKTANYNAALWEMVEADPTGGGFFVSLPAASSAIAGSSVAVKNASASVNAIVVNSFGGAIDGASTFTITVARACLHFTCDGTNWLISARF